MPPKKSAVLSALDASFPSAINIPSAPVSTGKTTGRKKKTYKTPAVVDSDDDVPLEVLSKPVTKTRAVSNVTVTKGKLKPGVPTTEVLELSDDPSEEDVHDDDASTLEDEQEGDDCEFEGDEDADEAVPNSEDVASDLEDFIVPDSVEAEESEENEEDIVRLAPGDSMYVDSSSPTNVRVKRPAPLTPPLATRSAKSRESKSGSPQASPTKKRRVAATEPDTTPVAPSTPARKKAATFPSADSLFDEASRVTAPTSPSKARPVAKKVAQSKSRAAASPEPVVKMEPDVDNVPQSPLSDLSDDFPEIITVQSAKKETHAKQSPVKAASAQTKSKQSKAAPARKKVEQVRAKNGEEVSASPVTPPPESQSKRAARPKRPPVKPATTASNTNQADPPTADIKDDEPTVGSDDDAFDAPGSLHDDKYMLYVKSTPTVCEVDNVGFHDRKLKAKGFYKNLPLLRRVDIIPLKESTTLGPVKFSSWPIIFPDGGLKISMVEKALSFVRSGRYINASRISPSELSGRPTNVANTRYEICTGGRATAILVSPCLVHASYLQEFHPLLKYSGHYFTGLLHVLELDRLISALGMVMHADALQMQIWSDALTFGTLSQGAGSKKEGTDNALSEAFDASASPTKARARPVNHDSVAIEPIRYDEKIPVYDGRGKDFSMDKDTLQNLETRFDPFTDELTRNSCVIVGYIAQIQTGKPMRLHLYAKCIILLGLQ